MVDVEGLTEDMLTMSKDELLAPMSDMPRERREALCDIYSKTQQDLHSVLHRNYDLYCMVLAEDNPDDYEALLHSSQPRTSFSVSQLLKIVFTIRRAGSLSMDEFGRYIKMFQRFDEEDFQNTCKVHVETMRIKFLDHPRIDVPDEETDHRPYVVGAGRNVFELTTCCGCGKPPTELKCNGRWNGPHFIFSTFELASKHVRSGLCEDCITWLEEREGKKS